jgi:CDGSH-type Zn-finger protein
LPVVVKLLPARRSITPSEYGIANRSFDGPPDIGYHFIQKSTGTGINPCPSLALHQMKKAKGTRPRKPEIEPLVDGPYFVSRLDVIRNSRDEAIAIEPGMCLCRCGGSANKPFCDGTHQENGFSGQKSKDREPDRLDTYAGGEIIIHDNRGVCAHFGYCTDNSPEVFDVKHDPWIDPDAADPEKTAGTIRMCPSGALSYTRHGVRHEDPDRPPAIDIAKDGPYCVTGNVELKDPSGLQPESKEHYSLCRCGMSKNKPFCDGSHWDCGFKDDKN